MRRPFGSYLVEALERIGREAPAAYAEICRALGARAIRIEVDGEVVTVTVGERRILVVAGAGSGQSALRAATSRAEIVALTDGVSSLEEALTSERVRLSGDAGDLACVFDALAAFVQGCGALSGAGAAHGGVPAGREGTIVNRKREATVVGGGIAGLTAAHELVERGFDVTCAGEALGGRGNGADPAVHARPYVADRAE